MPTRRNMHRYSKANLGYPTGREMNSDWSEKEARVAQMRPWVSDRSGDSH